MISETLVFTVVSLRCTGGDQHHVRFRGSSPEVPGSKRVHLPGGMCGQGGDVDRVSSVGGGGPRPGPGSASGTNVCTLTAFSLLIGSSSLTLVTLSMCVGGLTLAVLNTLSPFLHTLTRVNTGTNRRLKRLNGQAFGILMRPAPSNSHRHAAFEQ